MSVNGLRPRSASATQAGRALLQNYQRNLGTATGNMNLGQPADVDSSTDSGGSTDNNVQAAVQKASARLDEYLQGLDVHDIPAALLTATEDLKQQLQETLRDLEAAENSTLIPKDNFQQAQVTEAARFNQLVSQLKERNQDLQDEIARLRNGGASGNDPALESLRRELQKSTQECALLQQANRILTDDLAQLTAQHEQQMNDLQQRYATQLQQEQMQHEELVQGAEQYRRENEKLKRERQTVVSTAEYDRVLQELEQATASIEDLREQLDQAHQELPVDPTVEQELQQATAQVAELETQLEELNADYEKALADAARSDQLEEEVARLFEEASNTRTQLTQEKERTASLTKELQTARSQPLPATQINLDSDMEQLELELAEAQDNLTQEQARTAELSHELQIAKDEIAQQGVIVHANILQNEAMQQSLDQYRTSSESSRQRLQQITAENESLKRELKQLQEEVDQLRLTETDAEEERVRLTTAAAASQQQAESLRRQLEAGDRSSEQDIQLLEQQNAELRDLLEQQQQQHQRQESSRSLTSYLDDPATPTSQQQLAEIQEDLERMNLENTELRARLREAHQKELDYCSGLERLQGEMEFRVTEAERAREDALYDGVNLHVNLANKEEAIRELRIQVAKLEAANLKYDQLLNEATHELANEKDVNLVLKEFISKIGEKGDLSDQLCQEMEQEHELLERQHSLLQRNLHETTAKLAEQRERVNAQNAELESLQTALVEKMTVLQQSEREFQHQKALLDDRIAVHQQELQRRSHLLEQELEAKEELNNRYQDLQAQHDFLILQHEGDFNTMQRLKDYVEDLTRSSSHQQELTQAIAHTVATCQSWFALQSSQLEKEVRLAIDGLERRMRHLSSVVLAIRSVRRSHNEQVPVLQHKLAETTKRLHQLQSILDTERATAAHAVGDVTSLRTNLEDREEKILALQQNLSQAKHDADRLHDELRRAEAALRDSEDRLATASTTSAVRSQMHQEFGAQYTQLGERISALERALLDMSAQSARSFASRTREVATLEGEKMRGKRLIDHLRTTNAKLIGDLNDASQRAAESAYLQYRLEVVGESEKDATNRCRRLQQQLKDSEAQSLKLMNELENLTRQVGSNHEQQLAELRRDSAILREKLEQSQTGHLETRKQLELALSAAQTREVDLNDEVARLRQHRTADEEELRRIRSILDDQTQTLSETKRRAAELEGQYRASKSLNDELTAQVTRGAVLDGRLQELTNQRTKMAEQLQETQDELKDLRIKIQTKNDELNSMQSRLHQQVLEESKVRESEAQKTEELRNLRTRLTELTATRDSQDNELAAVRKQVHSLQTELAIKAEQLDHSQRMLQLSGDNEQTREAETGRWRQSYEQAMQRLSEKEQELTATERELAIQRRELSSQSERLKELKEQHRTMQSELTQRDSELVEYKTRAEEHQMKEGTMTQEIVRSREDKKLLVAQFSELDNELRALRNEEVALTGELRSFLFNIEKEHPRLALLSSTNSSRFESGSANPLHDLFDKLVQCVNALNVQLEQSREQAAHSNQQTKELLDLRQRLREAKADTDARAQQQVQQLRDQLTTVSQNMHAMRSERDDMKIQVGKYEAQARSVRRHLDSLLQVQVKELEERARQFLQGSLVVGSVSDRHSTLPLLSFHDSDEDRDHNDLVVVHRRLEEAGFEESEVLDEDIIDVKLRELLEGLDYVLQGMTTAVIKVDGQEDQIAELQQERSQFLDRALGAESTLADLQRDSGMMRTTLELEKQKVQRLENRAKELNEQHAELQRQLSDSMRQCQELRADARSHADNVSELRRALATAQEQTREKQSRLFELQPQLTDTFGELEGLREQNNKLTRRLADAELNAEAKTTEYRRLQSEHHAAQTAQAHLQREVDRQRKELSAFKGSMNSQAEDETRVGYELERLFSQLDSLFNHMRAELELDSWAQSKDSATRAVLAEPESFSLEAPQRSDRILKNLNLVRSFAREQRAVSERLNEEQRATQRVHAALANKTEQFGQEIASLREAKQQLEQSIRENSRANGALEHKLNSRDAELQHERTRTTDLQSQLDSLLKDYHQMQQQATNDAAEVRRLRASLQELQSQQHSLSAELSPIVQELASTKKRLDEKELELSGVKSHNSMLQNQFENISRELTELRTRGGALLSSSAECERLRTDLNSANDRVSALAKQLEQKQLEFARWKEASDTRYQTVFADVQRTQNEKRALQEEVTAIRLERDRLHQDVKRLQTEVAESRQHQLDHATRRMEASNIELQTQLQAAQNELDLLNQKCGNQQRLVRKLQDRENKHKQELEQAAKADEAMQKALTDTAAALRRTHQQLEETKADRDRIIGELKSFSTQRDGASQEVARLTHDLEKTRRVLSEVTAVLGDPSLHAHTERIRATTQPSTSHTEQDPLTSVQNLVITFKSMSREKADLITMCENLKRESQRLQRDFEALQNLHTTLERQHRAELSSLEDQLIVARQGDSRSHADMQPVVSGLRHQLEQERELRQQTQDALAREQSNRTRNAEEIRALRQQIAEVGQAVPQRDHTVERELRQSNERLSREVQQYVAQHAAQREALNALEEKLRRQTERLADVQSQDIARSRLANNIDEFDERDTVIRGLERQRIRNEVLEDIVALYRAALGGVQLTDASAVSGDVGAAVNVPLYKLLEQEIKRMLDLHAEESKFANFELVDLRGRLNHNAAYIRELEAQVTHSSNAMYQGTKIDMNDFGRLEIRRLTTLVEQEQAARQRLEHALSQLKQEYQDKHSAIMTDLVRAVQARDIALQATAQLELERVGRARTDDSQLEQYKAKVSSQKQELNQLQRQLHTATGDTENLRREVGELRQTVENLRINLNDKEAELRLLDKKYKRLKPQLAGESGHGKAEHARPQRRPSHDLGAVSAPMESRYDLGTTGTGSAYLRVRRGDSSHDRTRGVDHDNVVDDVLQSIDNASSSHNRRDTASGYHRPSSPFTTTRSII